MAEPQVQLLAAQARGAKMKQRVSIYKKNVNKSIFIVSRSYEWRPGASAKIEALERESEVLLTDLKLVEEYYATQALDLTIGLGYIERPLTNTQIEKYLATIVLRALHPDEQITEFFHLFPFEVGHRLAGAEIRVNWFRARIECGAPILARLA